MKNVVLLTIDTLRKDALGCYGSGKALTPNIDNISKSSIIFNNHISAGSYTQASFPGILSSSYFLEFGSPKKLSEKRTLISEAVKTGGFTTAAFHSNPYLSGYFGWNRGWDEFYDSMKDDVNELVPYIKGDAINQKAADWLKGYTADDQCKPFFMWLHYMDIHEPYIPPQKYIDKVGGCGDLKPEQMLDMFKNILLPRNASDSNQVELLKKLYHAHICEVDEYVGQLFNMLKDLDLLENTIVILTTDHGDEFGEHGSLSHDGKFYSELINVPLLIYDSSFGQGQKVDTIVSGVDIAPTVCHLLGTSCPENWHGQSLLPLDGYVSKGVFGEAVGKLKHRIIETDRPAHFYQQGNLRISHRSEDNSWQLYDLQADPAEKNNIVNSHPEAEVMKDKLRTQITWWEATDESVYRVERF
ncbi:MAG: sulfatase [Sedimentisphaerales bacterium]|nr:sulfatase [Sedimentisphaerales bacterium]